MFQRPKVGETEKDLLDQQREFLRTSGKPPPKNTETRQDKVEAWQTDVMVEIKEKKVSSSALSFEFKSQQSKGFPKPFVIDSSLYKAGKKNEKSLFAQEMEKKRKKINDVENKDVNKSFDDDVQSVSTKKLHTSEEYLKNEIHKENIEKLSKLSEIEILEEQRKLLSTLDPSLVKYLKNRSKVKQPGEVDIQTSNTNEVEGATRDNLQQVSDDTDDTEIRNKLESYLDSKWINMDFIEKEKLEWIGEIPDKKALDSDQPYSARFNFKGELQPFTMEIDVTTSLYHHGEEPERPGYTIQELYQLSRSQVLQQRILALNCLSNLIRKTKLGYYDNCFNGQLLHKLMELDLFFLLRFSIDENALIPASIFCLHNLLCNECDEFCLDKLLGVTNRDEQPLIRDEMDVTSKEEEGELNDHVVIGVDLIKGVLRTDLLLRMSYILNKCAPNKETTVRIINCLIRICRHSSEAAWKVAQAPNLLGPIYECITSDRPVPEALKLLRVMCSVHSNDVAKAIVRQFDVMYLVSFFEMDENPYLTKKDFYLLKLETLYFWRNLLERDLMMEEFVSWSPCLVRLLFFYSEKVQILSENEFDFELFAAMTSLILVPVKKKISLDSSVVQIMRICLEKWLTQLVDCREHGFSKSKALGAVFRYFATYLKTCGVTKDDLDFINRVNSLLTIWLQSRVYADMATALTTYSYVLFPSVVERDPDNLPSLCTVYNGGEEFLKIVQPKSSLPFFMSLVKYLRRVFIISLATEPILRLFLDSTLLRNYMTKVLDSQMPSDSKWFTKYEMSLMTGLVRLMYLTNHPEVFPTCFKTISMLRIDDRHTKRMFQVLFERKTLGVEDEFFDTLVPVYLETFATNESGPMRYKGEVVPHEWPYKILVSLRSKEDNATVKKVLKFLCLLLNRKQDLLNRVSHTLRFYFLCYVFLTDSYVFDGDIQNLMEDVFRNVKDGAENLRLEQKLNKNKSFYDLYTELITQYSGVSYGLPIFAQFVLLPLQNSQDIAFRKLIWFEYLHVLRVVSLPFPLEGFLPVRAFIEPCETDESLLVAYLNSTCNGVITKVRNPYVYAIAVGNLKNFISSGPRDQKLLNFIMKKVESLKNVDLKNDILNFCF